MIETIIYFSVIILQAIIFVQDCKYRAIHFLLPVFLFIFSVVDFGQTNKSIWTVLPSYIYLCVCLVAGYTYFVLKNRAFFNPFLSIMGIGDVVYFVSIVLFFSTQSFVLFFVGSLIFSILCFSILKLLDKKTVTIPLAGFSALFFLLIKFIAFILNEDLFRQKIFF